MLSSPEPGLLRVTGGRLKDGVGLVFGALPTVNAQVAFGTVGTAQPGWSRLKEVTKAKELDFDTLRYDLAVAGDPRVRGLCVHRVGTTWIDSFDLSLADFQKEIKLVFKGVITAPLPDFGSMKFAAQKLYATTSKGTKCTHRVLYSDNGQLLGYLNVAKSFCAVTSITWFRQRGRVDGRRGYVINRTRPLVIQPIDAGSTLPSGNWFSATTPRFLG